MISIFGQFSGNGLGVSAPHVQYWLLSLTSGYFNVVIFANLGVSSVAQQLGYNLLNSVISAIGALSAVSLTDRMPRRPVLIWGTLACAGLLAINSGLSAVLAKQGDVVDLGVARGALAAYFLFNVVFSFTYTPLQGVIPAEALETTMRAKGLAASGIIVNAVGFINQFAGPVGLGNLGYKYIFIFVGWDCFESLMWYFFWYVAFRLHGTSPNCSVESQGRTLEQLEWVYNQPNPVKASKKVVKVAVDQASGHVVGRVDDL